MKNKPVLIILLFISVIQLNFAGAQGTSYLPANAVNVTHTPGSGVANSMFTLIEQRGLVPYKGRTCNEESESFTENQEGKKFGANEYVSAHVLIQHYTQQGKLTFDQILQYSHPASELKKFEAAAMNDVPGGASRSVINKEATDGRIAIQNDLIQCIESKFKDFHTIFFRSYAITGTTIVTIDGSYNSDDVSIAEKVHNEIVSNIKKTGIK